MKRFGGVLLLAVSFGFTALAGWTWDLPHTGLNFAYFMWSLLATAATLIGGILALVEG